MALLDVLAALGFTNSSLVSEAKGIVTAKIRTARGWTYERFKTPADVHEWARGKVPG